MVFVLMSALWVANDPSSAGQLKVVPARPPAPAQLLLPLPLSNTKPDLGSILIDDGFSTKHAPALLRHILQALSIESRRKATPNAINDLFDLFDGFGRLKPGLWKTDYDADKIHICIGKCNGLEERRQFLVHGSWTQDGRLDTLEWTRVKPYVSANNWRFCTLFGLWFDRASCRITKTAGKCLSIFIGGCADLEIQAIFSDEMRLLRLEISLGYYSTRGQSYRVAFDCISGTWISIHHQEYDEADVWLDLLNSLPGSAR
jgi:hypothetical protein